MNISDLIMSQLTSPDVLSKLGGLIGANESQTKTATSAAVPSQPISCQRVALIP